MELVIALIIAIVGTFSDEARFAVCDTTNIEEVAEAQGYYVYEDCSFVMED